jgi:hypothetical protein
MPLATLVLKGMSSDAKSAVVRDPMQKLAGATIRIPDGEWAIELPPIIDQHGSSEVVVTWSQQQKRRLVRGGVS